MSLNRLRDAGTERSPVLVSAFVGLLAGIPTGIVLQLGTDLMSVLGGVIGTESVVAGWIVHLALSTVFGAFFGWHVRWPVFRTLTDRVSGSVLWGVIFSIVWYAYVVVGVVIPGLTALLGFPMGDVPGPATGGLLPAFAFSIAYIFWGAALGFGYASVEAGSAEPEPRGPDVDAESRSSE